MTAMKTPLILVAAFAASLAPAAHAAVLPGKLPASPVFPVSLPGVLPEAAVSLKPVVLPLLPSLPTLPSMPLPVQAPSDLPAPQSPLPLGHQPADFAAKAAKASRPALDWSFLDRDGGDAAPELVPVDPGPAPLPPSKAAEQLRFAAEAAHEPAPVSADSLFDHSRPRHGLLTVLPD
jgi:hypothetical protein